MFLLLDEINVRLGHIEKQNRDAIPEGKLESTTLSLLPGGLTIDLGSAPQYQMRGPWASVTITNDGGSDIQVSVNSGVTTATVKPEESRTIDMKARGKIRSVKLTVTAATTVRFDGVV